MKKKWLATILVAMLAVSIPANVSAAWKKTDSGHWQWSENGILSTGWEKIDKQWYYFDQNANMTTGWINDGGNWYYLNSNGTMKTGWLYYNEQWYYLNPDGSMATGWKTINSCTYYLKNNGSMATGWQRIDGQWYRFTADGTQVTGWTEVNGQRYFLNADGVMQTGVVQVDGKTYFFGENGQILTGRLWVDGKRYDFADTGEATGSKKPIPEKAFDTKGNQTQVVEDNPTLSDDDNTHTGSMGGWYPDIDWNPGGNTGDGQQAGGTVNPDPEKPSDGDQGIGQPDPEEKLEIQVPNGSWKETTEGIEFSTKEGTHLSGKFDFITNQYTAFSNNGVWIYEFSIDNLFDPNGQFEGDLSYKVNLSDSDRQSATLTETKKNGEIYTLTFANLDKIFTIKLKISTDYKKITLLDVFTNSFKVQDGRTSYISVDFDIVSDDTEVVYTESQLRGALADKSIKKIILNDADIFYALTVSDTLVIDRDVEIQAGTEGSLTASDNWVGGNKPLISIQNGAKVRIWSGRYTGRLDLQASAESASIIEVVNGTLECSVYMTASNSAQKLLYLENASVKIYDSGFRGDYKTSSRKGVGIEMDTAEGSKSTLDILSATFEIDKQIISGSPNSILNLPSNFIEFINSENQREWTNDPSKVENIN